MSTGDNKTISQDAILELERLAANLDIDLEMTANMPAEELNDSLLLMGLNPKDALPPHIKELLSKYPAAAAEQVGEACAFNPPEEEPAEEAAVGMREREKAPPFQGTWVKEQDLMVALAKKDTRFKETWQPRLSLILSFLALTVTLLVVLIKDYQAVGDFVARLTAQKMHLAIIISNLVVSLIALVFMVKQKAVDFVIEDNEKFRSLAELDEEVDMQIYSTNLNNRVGRLVNQFRIHMVLFAFSLVLIYGVLFFGALAPGSEMSAEGQQDAPRMIGYFPVSTNLINLLGALFVYLGFSVLFNKTIEPHQVAAGPRLVRAGAGDDQRSLETRQFLNYNSSLYWGIPLMMFVLYALVFVSLSVSYVHLNGSETVTRFLNIFDLLAGSANGLTMSLLFGRYVSVEQSIGHTPRFKTVFENIFYPFSSVPYKALVSLSIIFILPIYALAQPLFGSLRITAFGDADTFQTVVFAICLVGKICFFHLTYILVSKKLLHLYLYGLVAEIGNYKELDACFETPPDNKGLGPVRTTQCDLIKEPQACESAPPQRDRAGSRAG